MKIQHKKNNERLRLELSWLFQSIMLENLSIEATLVKIKELTLLYCCDNDKENLSQLMQEFKGVTK